MIPGLPADWLEEKKTRSNRRKKQNKKVIDTPDVLETPLDLVKARLSRFSLLVSSQWLGVSGWNGDEMKQRFESSAFAFKLEAAILANTQKCLKMSLFDALVPSPIELSTFNDRCYRPEGGDAPSEPPVSLMTNQQGHNVCFANCVFQLLGATDRFLYFIDQIIRLFVPHDGGGEAIKVVRIFLDFVNTFLVDRTFIFDWNVGQRRDLLNQWRVRCKDLEDSQQDAAEFLVWFLEQFSTAFQVAEQGSAKRAGEDDFQEVGTKTLRQSAEDSIKIDLISFLFEGQLIHIRPRGTLRIETIEPFNVLAIPVPSVPKSLPEVLDGYFTQETGTRLHHMPSLLFIQLQRAQYDPCFQQVVKSATRITIPEQFSVKSVWLSNRLKTSLQCDIDWTLHPYKLKAIIRHLGNNPFGGHYVALISRQLSTGLKWYLSDDMNLEEIPVSPTMPGCEQDCYVMAYEMEGVLPICPLVHTVVADAPWVRQLIPSGTS